MGRSEQAHETFDVVRPEGPADPQGAELGIGEDQLLTIQAIEFGHSVGQRCLVELQTRGLPGELAFDLLRRDGQDQIEERRVGKECRL